MSFFKSRSQFIVLALIICVSQPSFSESAKYSVTNVSWCPYWIIRPNQVSGILNDIMLKIDQHINTSLVANRTLPVKRAQMAFRDGDLHIECCINEAWRTTPAQTKVSLWTNTVLTVEEVLIFPVGKAFDFKQLEELKGKSIATVRGMGTLAANTFDEVTVATIFRKYKK